MFERYLDLAASKAVTDEERDALQPIIAIASEVDGHERGFEARINASKAARGEKPTRVSKATRRELDHYATDARDIEDEQFREFDALGDARPIVHALRTGLDSDIGFWTSLRPRGHPADEAILQEFVQAKARLRDALADYLERFPGQGD